VLPRVAVVLLDDGLSGLCNEPIVQLHVDLGGSERSAKWLSRQPEPLGPSVVRRSENDERGLAIVPIESIGRAVGAEPSFGRNVGRGESPGKRPLTRSRHLRRESLVNPGGGIRIGGADVRRFTNRGNTKGFVLPLFPVAELVGLEKALLGEESHELADLLAFDEDPSRETGEKRLGVDLGVRSIEAGKESEPGMGQNEDGVGVAERIAEQEPRPFRDRRRHHVDVGAQSGKHFRGLSLTPQSL
jgi:hypothetical protein